MTPGITPAPVSSKPFPAVTGRSTPCVTARAVTDSKPSAARRAISHLQTDFVYTSNARTHQHKTSACDTPNHTSSITRSIQYSPDLYHQRTTPNAQLQLFSHPTSESGVLSLPSSPRRLAIVDTCLHSRLTVASLGFSKENSVKHLLFTHLLS